MAENITCICGYRGPGVADRQGTICPICRSPAKDLTGNAGSSPPPESPAFPSSSGAAAAPQAGAPVAPGETSRKTVVYRIPCPRGHLLKAAETMIGQQVVCPSCNEFFVLAITDSLEYKKEMQRRQDEKEARQAEQWLRWAIMAAVFVVASFIAMFAIKILWR